MLVREEAWRVIDESGDTHETTVRRLVHESGIWIEVVIGGKSDRFQMTAPSRIAPVVRLPWGVHLRERWTERACDALGLPSPRKVRAWIAEARRDARATVAHEFLAELVTLVEAQTDLRVPDRRAVTLASIGRLRALLDVAERIAVAQGDDAAVEERRALAHAGTAPTPAPPTATDDDEGWVTVSKPGAALEVQTLPLTDHQRHALDVGNLFRKG